MGTMECYDEFQKETRDIQDLIRFLEWGTDQRLRVVISLTYALCKILPHWNLPIQPITKQLLKKDKFRMENQLKNPITTKEIKKELSLIKKKLNKADNLTQNKKIAGVRGLREELSIFLNEATKENNPDLAEYKSNLYYYSKKDILERLFQNFVAKGVLMKFNLPDWYNWKDQGIYVVDYGRIKHQLHSDFTSQKLFELMNWLVEF